MHGEQVVEPGRGQQFAVAAEVGGGLHVVHHEVPADDDAGGDVRAGGEPFREAIQSWLRELTLDGPSGPPSVVFAESTDNATLLGAAGLVLSHVFHTRA